jgi:hypothetical protein
MHRRCVRIRALGILGVFALGAVAAIPEDATLIHVDRGGWPAAVEAPADRSDEDTRFLWWWSAACVPQRSEPGEAPECVAGREVDLVVSDARGEPVEGARLLWGTEALRRGLPDRLLPAAISDAEGRATIVVPEEEPVSVRVAGPHLASLWTAVDPAARRVGIRTRPAASLELTLRGEDGKPVERARLELQGLERDELLFWDAANESTLALPPLPEELVFQALIWSESHAPWSGTLHVGRAPAVVTLEEGRALSGRLTDAESEPLEGEITAIFAVPGSTRGVRRTLRTRPDGSFELRGLPGRSIEWVASSAGYAARLGAADLEDASANLGRITLHAARVLRIAVLDEGGGPVAGARVTLEGSRSTTVDTKGRAEIEDAPAQEVKAVVRARGYLDTTVVIPAGETETVVTLRRGAGVVGDLLLTATGAPPATAHVEIRSGESRSTRRITIGERFELFGLQPGRTRLRIDAPGALPFTTPDHDLAEGETWDFGVVWLEEGFSLRGRVIDEEGQPVEGATTRALRTGEFGPVMAFVMRNWDEATTDADGRFVLEGLRPGAQLLMIEGAGYVPVVRADVSLDPDGAERSGEVGDVVLPRGRGLRVVCRPAAECGTETALLLAGPQFPFLGVTTGMSEGIAQFDAAPPGRSTLHLMRGQVLIHDTEVEVSSRRDLTEVEIELPSVRVEGDVETGGRRARGGTVTFRRGGGGDTIPVLFDRQSGSGTSLGTRIIGNTGSIARGAVDREGRFVVESIAPGEWTVHYSDQGGSTGAIAVMIPDTGSHYVPLRFPGGEIAGIVLDDAGRPATAAIEVVDGHGSRLQTSAGTDGRFRVIGLGSGAAVVSARGRAGSASATVDPSRPAAKELVLRLEPQETRELVVELVGADGSPAAGASVFLERPERLQLMTADGEGRARFGIENDPRGLRIAGYHPWLGWVFGEASGATARLRFSDSGGALVIAASGTGIVELFGPTGFPLHRALPMVGTSTHLGTGAELRIDRLPAGRYFVRSGGNGETVTVERGKTTRVSP